MVKSMPGPPEWKKETITLTSAPNEPQAFYYRDLEACAHYLFQRPDLESHMEYSHMEVYDEAGDQYFHEVCTGNEWKVQQVSISHDSK